MWNILFNEGVLTVSVVLMVIGLTLKTRTGTNNNLIALILLSLSLAIWLVIGFITDRMGFWHIVGEYCLKRGLLSSGIAVFLYDVFHNTKKACTRKHVEEEKKEVTNLYIGEKDNEIQKVD